jgi:hypothetical protein
MTDYIGITTKSNDGDGSLKVIRPASGIALVNDSGTLGVIVDGEQKGISAQSIVSFTTLPDALQWLNVKE